MQGEPLLKPWKHSYGHAGKTKDAKKGKRLALTFSSPLSQCPFLLCILLCSTTMCSLYRCRPLSFLTVLMAHSQTQLVWVPLTCDGPWSSVARDARLELLNNVEEADVVKDALVDGLRNVGSGGVCPLWVSPRPIFEGIL